LHKNQNFKIIYRLILLWLYLLSCIEVPWEITLYLLFATLQLVYLPPLQKYANNELERGKILIDMMLNPKWLV